MGARWERDLDDLRWHWGDAYVIHYFPGPDLWIARRTDTRETVTAGAPGELHDAILADYETRKVPR